jgi:two-component system sensor histidine kinase BaeS
VLSDLSHVAFALSRTLEVDGPTWPGRHLLRQIPSRPAPANPVEVLVIDAQSRLLGASVSDLAGMVEPWQGFLRPALGGRTVTHFFPQAKGRAWQAGAFVPILQSQTVVGVVGAALRGDDYARDLRPVQGLALLATGLVFLLAVGVSSWVARSIARPIHAMQLLADDLADGHLDQPVRIRGPDEIDRLAAALNRMAQQLAHLEKVRSELIANVSHDLRTPVSNIRVAAEAAAQRIEAGKLPPLRLLEGVVAETERLNDFIDDVLELSRLESGVLALHLEPLDLAAWTQELVAALRPRLEEKGLTLIVEIPPHLPPFRADHDRLWQAVMNLLDNAVKFTPDGGRITFSATAEKAGFTLSVADTGPGIAAEDLPFLFERFFKADRSRDRRQGGAGLGLAIAKRLVEAHGGRISVESTPGVGTTFRLWLPR